MSRRWGKGKMLPQTHPTVRFLKLKRQTNYRLRVFFVFDPHGCHTMTF